MKTENICARTTPPPRTIRTHAHGSYVKRMLFLKKPYQVDHEDFCLRGHAFFGDALVRERFADPAAAHALDRAMNPVRMGVQKRVDGMRRDVQMGGHDQFHPSVPADGHAQPLGPFARPDLAGDGFAVAAFEG